MATSSAPRQRNSRMLSSGLAPKAAPCSQSGDVDTVAKAALEQPAQISVWIGMPACIPESGVPNQPIAARDRDSTRLRPSSLTTFTIALPCVFQQPALQIPLAQDLGSALLQARWRRRVPVT